MTIGETMTNDQLHPSWGPIPEHYPAGNDELEYLGVRTRHYLNHSDGHWHLGIPSELDYVPYASTALERNRRALDRRRNGERIANRRRRTRTLARALAWLDTPIRPEHPMTRLAAGLAAIVAVFSVFALAHYATH